MPSPRDVLTPDALAMLHTIEQAGSMAAAARALQLVPSALTYRVRQMEEALDVLLFDRRSRQAKLTPAGRELLREGERLLADIDAIAHRVKRVATGWESQFTLAVDGVIDSTTVMELCEAFLSLDAPTRLRVRDEVLTGTLQAVTSGQADLALGVSGNPGNADTVAGVHSLPLGPLHFVFAVSPNHPLAHAPEPLSDALIGSHRAVAVADSVQRGAGMTVGLLPGQDVLTVPHIRQKIEAQVRGLGVGFVPESMVRPWIERGLLVIKRVERPQRIVPLTYAWRTPAGSEGERGGRALQWWLKQLKSPTTRAALLVHPNARSMSTSTSASAAAAGATAALAERSARHKTAKAKR
jgi:DNA-binding transcriptional LysR family regulator